MNKITQIPKSLEQVYQSHLEPEKKRSLRVMSVLGLLLYMAFIVVDFWALPSALFESLLIRGIVITGFVFGYLSTYFPFFIKHYNYIQPAPYLFAALGIELMIFLAAPTDQASNVYFAGLILVIMVLFSWSHLKVGNLLVTTSLIIGLYVAIEIRKYNSVSSAYLPVLLPNVFFLCSAAIIGFATQLMRDQYLRHNFLLQQSLQNSVDKKTKEVEVQEYRANHDPLTGLPNRRYANDRLENFLKRAQELDMSMVILYLDLNGFKKVNDIYGHNAGDEVLKIVAKRLKSCVRHGDCLARMGGDEFVVGFMVEKDELEIVDAIRKSIEKAIIQPIGFAGNEILITVSIGMASYPSSGNQLAVLFEIADKRMYLAKQKNKNKQLDLDSEEDEIEFLPNQKPDPIIIFPG